MSEAEILAEAEAAFSKAANEAFDADGRRDVGTCGSYMLTIDARSKIARLAVKQGKGHNFGGGRGTSLSFRADGVASQAYHVWDAAQRAAADVLRSHNVRIIKAYAWVD